MKNQENLLTLKDWSVADIEQVLNTARDTKSEFKMQGASDALKGKTIALYFEKPSLRTIITFQVGITQLGGSSVILDPSSIGMGKREPIKDIARCLSRWVDALVVRCFDQALVEELAEWSSVPVINALTDDYHPCQALAFGQSVIEHKGTLLGKKVVFIGDGNNVANSLMILAAKMGMHFVLSCPKGYEQPAGLVEEMQALFAESGGSYACIYDPEEAVKGADVLYSDVWVSMGQESEKDEKAQVFEPYAITAELVAQAGDGCLVTHCLPAHRGEEITDAVMESDYSICFDEAENRLHAQKGVMLDLIKGIV
ncbi:MAG: ornithine carbamoyltransferase [Fibrobacterales bacterium]